MDTATHAAVSGIAGLVAVLHSVCYSIILANGQISNGYSPFLDYQAPPDQNIQFLPDQNVQYNIPDQNAQVIPDQNTQVVIIKSQTWEK